MLSGESGQDGDPVQKAVLTMEDTLHLELKEERESASQQRTEELSARISLAATRKSNLATLMSAVQKMVSG